MLAYVKPGLLNLDRSLKQPTAQLRAAQNCSVHTGETHTLLCMLRHIQYIYMHTYICKDTHTRRGYSVRSPKRITSLEPLGGCRQNEKQTDRERGEVEKDKMSHERVWVTHINFHVS